MACRKKAEQEFMTTNLCQRQKLSLFGYVYKIYIYIYIYIYMFFTHRKIQQKFTCRIAAFLEMLQPVIILKRFLDLRKFLKKRFLCDTIYQLAKQSMGGALKVSGKCLKIALTSRDVLGRIFL